jgi:hypothetical protein
MRIEPADSLRRYVISTDITEAEMTQAETSRGRSQDRAKVAGGQEHEVRYEAEKTGKTKDEVKDVIKSEGNSRKAVEKKLDSK